MTIHDMIEGEDEDKMATEVVVDTDDGPTEIEIPDEELSTSEANASEDAAAKAEKKQNRVPADKRIGKLTRRAKEAEEYTVTLQQELEKERQRTKQIEMEKLKSDGAAMTHYAARVETELALAKRAHSEALSSGDPDKITDTQMELSRLSSEKAEVDRWKARQPKPDAAPRDEPRGERQAQPQEQERAAPKLAPEAQRWVDETTWFNPQSDDYDPLLHRVAVNYAQVIEAEYVENGRADEIGTSSEYFQDIENFVRSRYPDRFGEPAAKPNGSRQPAMGAGRPDTAPPARNGVPAANGNGSRNVVTLSADEKDMARRMMANGHYKDKTGKKITEPQEAYKRYALDKIRLEQADRARQ